LLALKSFFSPEFFPLTRADRVQFLKPVFLLLLFFTLSNCGEAENKNVDHVKQGIEYTKQQKYDKAVESFLKAIEKNPKNPEGYYGLGGMYNYKKMFSEAEQAFKTSIRLDPTHFNAHYSLGYTYELMGKKDAAEKEYQRYRDLKKKFDALTEEDSKTP